MGGFTPITSFGSGLQYPKLWTQYNRQKRFCWCTMALGMMRSRSYKRWNPVCWTCRPSLWDPTNRVPRGPWPTGKEPVWEELKRVCCCWAVAKQYRTCPTITSLVYEGRGGLRKLCSWRRAHLFWCMFLEVVNCSATKTPGFQKKLKTGIWRA